jgi:hypothetical protein
VLARSVSRLLGCWAAGLLGCWGVSPACASQPSAAAARADWAARGRLAVSCAATASQPAHTPLPAVARRLAQLAVVGTPACLPPPALLACRLLPGQAFHNLVMTSTLAGVSNRN